jgi:para-aminobenzoate synthetase
MLEDTTLPRNADADQVISMQKRRKTSPSCAPVVILPNKASYISRVRSAKDHLFAGDSYELCVTAPTRIIRDKSSLVPNVKSASSSWELYKTLRAKNPAPFSAYLRLHPSTLVASSPERFLSYSRGPGTVCQLRPIKGTLRKGTGVTRAVAEQALAGNRKEVAENLMIVDLIRHDLHGVVGEDVQVKKFCGVEESETVWSLVSVIEGKLPSTTLDTPSLDADGELGWEVLSRSLPPGK